MPFISGRFYMNPAYGRAVEAARAADAASQHHESDQQEQDAHWVTIDQRHVLIHEAQENRNRPNRRPGSKLARIIFNETSGLRPGNQNPGELHDARVAIAHTLLNTAGMRHPPSTVSDVLTPSAAQAILSDADAKAAWADAQVAVQDAAQSPDDTGGAIHFFLDYEGATHQKWTTEDRETANYGPFINVAGGGDVPRGVKVTVRIYTERPRY
jgi:hypothetical protein